MLLTTKMVYGTAADLGPVIDVFHSDVHMGTMYGIGASRDAKADLVATYVDREWCDVHYNTPDGEAFLELACRA